MILLCQTAAQLLSASMIIYALNNTIKQSSTSSVILQPWFMVLVVAGAIERLAGLALGVTMERDWVVMVIWMTCTFENGLDAFGHGWKEYKHQPVLPASLAYVVSRLGHMSYDVVGTQILQTGIPTAKANLIGITEVSMASLAELLMFGVAIIANDVSHFGFLATLSVSSVAVAALIFCWWLANPTDGQKKLFKFDAPL
ncbi:hypothetical protein B296_00016231 [Ensete ventricosum]|uniref:Solute carrier family 40 member n=1 Tax=Ensete ventricosum TaxID=4639 RepID=A0A426Z8F7_ENSVE|nr:hypothetical protein B296_00016231 [Ensete ventricosum]